MPFLPCRAAVTNDAFQQPCANIKIHTKTILVGVCLQLLLAGGANSEPQICDRSVCTYMVDIASSADDKVYGLLISDPKTGCPLVRYRVETTGRMLLGKTPVLAAGEVAVVRIGKGFQQGAHTLVVTAEGCSKPSPLFRQVTLNKASPDYGWRAASVNAMPANPALPAAR